MTPHAQRRTYRFVKNYVTHNVLSDNVPINVKEIARVLGVSQVPVRESLFRIAHDGLIDYLPEKGFFARNLSQAEISDACTIGRAVAISTLDESFLRRHEAALLELVTLVGRSESRGTSGASHAFWWAEAVLRRLVRVGYSRQPRWHLTSILDQTLAFRRVVPVDVAVAARLEAMLAALASHFANRELVELRGVIGQFVEHEANRLSQGYPVYLEAVTRARRFQNAVNGAVEGVLFVDRAVYGEHPERLPPASAHEIRMEIYRKDRHYW